MPKINRSTPKVMMVKFYKQKYRCWGAYESRDRPRCSRGVLARRFNPSQDLHTRQRQGGGRNGGCWGEGWGARMLVPTGSYQSTAHPLFSKKSSQASLRSRLGRRSSGSRCSLVTGSVLERLRCSRMLDLS